VWRGRAFRIRMSKHRRLAATTLLVGLAFSACKAKSAIHASDEATRNAPAAADKGTATGGDGELSGKQDTTKAIGGLDNDRKRNIDDGRKVIRTGRIEILVGTYDDARAKIDALVQQAGGYVDATNVNRRQDQISDATI